MARVAWINPTSGVSGDMCLSAMVDLGADQRELLKALGTIEALNGFRLGFRSVTRGGIRALYAEVELPETAVHRRLCDIISIIEASGLAQSQKKLSKEIFQNLAQAEARVHGVPVEEVELHEVGSLDTILDVCGFAVAKELIGIDLFFAAPPALGRGTTSGVHGRLAVPAPAVLELLAGREAFGGVPEFEATTPTGAAILATVSVGCDQMPQMTIDAVGTGAGRKDAIDYPNVLQMVLGTVNPSNPQPPRLPGHFEKIVELQTNLDDITGELGGYLISALMSKGAIDVFVVAALAKKDRPGVVLTAVVNPGDVARISTEIFALTGTLGIRSQPKERYVLDREFFEITLFGEKLAVKSGPVRAKVEFSDLVRLAEMHGVPILQLERMAQAEIEKHLAASSVDLD